MEPTIYKPSIYNGAGVYKTGAEGGGGGGEIQIKQIYGQPNLYIVDTSGYIGFTIAAGDYIKCLVDTNADYSGLGLGQVKFYTKQTRTIQINGLDFETTIINGVEWLAQNLDIYTDEMGINALWYNYNENLYGRNGKNYGMLYNYSAVDIIRNNLNNWAPGWRIPTGADYNKLRIDCGNSIAGKCLSSNVGGFEGFGTNNFSFNACPAGYEANGFYNVESRIVFPVYIGSGLEYYIKKNVDALSQDNGYTNHDWRCSLRLCRDVV